MKWFIRIAATLLILIVLISVSLSVYLSDERLTSLIMPPLKEVLGDSVKVDKLGYTFFSTFPNFGLVIEGLHLSSPEGEPVADLKRMRVTVPIFPLFSGNVEVKRLHLDTPDISYILFADGRTNIDFLMTETDTTATEASASSIQLDEITVVNGRITYDDRPGKTRFIAAGMGLTAAIRLGEMIESDVDATFAGISLSMNGSTYLDSLPISLNQRSVLDMTRETLTLSEGAISIRGLALNTTGSVSAWSGDSMAYAFEFASASDNFGALLDLVPDEYKDKVKGITTRGALTLKGSVKGNLAMDYPDFDVVLAVTDGYLKHPSAAKPIEDIQIDISASNALVTIANFQARAEQNTIRATGKVERPLEKSGLFSLDAVVKADLGTLETYYPVSDFGVTLRGLLDVVAKGNGRLDAPEAANFTASLIWKDGWLKYTEVEKPIEDIQLNVTATQALATITSFKANAAGNTLSLTGTVNQPLNQSKSRFDVNAVMNMDLASIKQFYPIDEDSLKLSGKVTLNARATGLVSDPEAVRFNGGMTVANVAVTSIDLMQPITNMNGNLVFSDANVDLKAFTFKMGSSDFSFTGVALAYRNLFEEVGKANPMRLTATYASKFLNVDEIYDINDTNEDPLYMELPNLSSSLTARIDSMVFVGIPITNVRGRATTTPKMLEMNESSANVFSGAVSGYMKWDIPQRDYTWITFRGDLTNVRSEVFFKEFQLGGKSDFHKYISGGFTAKANFVTAMDEMLVQEAKTIQADGSFGMDRARLKGHPIQMRIANLLNVSEFGDVSLDAWTATFTIKDGLMTLRDMNLTSKDIGLNLNGTQNLVNDRIDYKVHITLPGSYGNRLEPLLTKDGVEALKDAKGMIVVPIAVTGTSADPSVGVDKDFLQRAIREYLRKKAGDAAGRILQGIIRN